ncbi:MAG: substrate-binding domain-containing protein [Fimbriimonas sp.]
MMRHLIAALAFAVIIGGCSQPATESKGPEATKAPEPAAAGTIRIAVIPKGTTHEFWKSVHAGADDAAKELGVEVIWKGPVKEDDRESQIKTVEDFVTNKVSGIVLAPLDDTALRGPVDEAKGAGIDTVIIDSALKSEDTVSFVATDNKKGGYLGGKRLAELLGGKGKVVLLRYQEGSASTAEREQGFLDAMKEAPGIQVVSSNQYGGATVETAQKAGENLLAPYKQGDKLTIDGIFTPNESTTFGLLRVLEDGGLAGKVKFVGFDASTKLIEGLRADKINALVVQNPRKMGYLGVKTMVAHLKKEKVDKRVDTGVVVIDKATIDSTEIKKLIEPPKE